MKTTVFYVMAFALGYGLMLGQPPAPKVDPELCLGFLRYHNSLVQEIEKRKPTDPGGSQALDRSVSRQTGVNSRDLGAANGVFRGVQAELDVLDRESGAYLSKRSHRKVGGTVFLEYQTRAQKIVDSVPTRLQAAMSQEGWAALQKYIDNEIRPNRVPLIRKP